MNELLINIDKIYANNNTITRLKKELDLKETDLIAFIKNKLLDENCKFIRIGTQYYCNIDNFRIVIYAKTYRIITIIKYKSKFHQK